MDSSVLDDLSLLIDESYADDKYANTLNDENGSLDEYEDNLTNVYLEELTSNERAKKACDNILHVLKEDGRHRVILNELNYNLQEFARLKERYYQNIYSIMYDFVAQLIHEYQEQYSSDSGMMVQRVKEKKQIINDNITQIKEELSKSQKKRAMRDITHVDHEANILPWYERPRSSRRPFFL